VSATARPARGEAVGTAGLFSRRVWAEELIVSPAAGRPFDQHGRPDRPAGLSLSGQRDGVEFVFHQVGVSYQVRARRFCERRKVVVIDGARH
jgi:hypothetical protein